MFFLGCRDDPSEADGHITPFLLHFFLQTPGLGECNSDFMYTKQLLKKIKERLCFKQQELKPSAAFITSPLNLLSQDSRNEGEAPFKCRFPVLALSNK